MIDVVGLRGGVVIGLKGQGIEGTRVQEALGEDWSTGTRNLHKDQLNTVYAHSHFRLFCI